MVLIFTPIKGMGRAPTNLNLIRIRKDQNRDFPGGPAVKNLPANAGDAGSIPGSGRYHVPRSN